MPRILMTGASGGIGTSLRKLLPPIYPDLLLSDIKQPSDLGGHEKFKAADLADLAQVEAVCEGVDGILHFGGYSVEGSWDAILQANIIGGYNLFEAARKQGVKRVIFASSNHAVGFYPRHHRIGTDVTARPDSRYGVSKVFGEGVGALYADKHGIKVTCIRIGNFGEAPLDHRRLSIWLSSAGSGSNIPISISRCCTARRTMSARGGTITAPMISAIVRPAAAKIFASTRWPSRPSCRPIRSATTTRAARSAAWNSTATGQR
jgi:nucleoside-diphosphate-sugar epimerase